LLAVAPHIYNASSFDLHSLFQLNAIIRRTGNSGKAIAIYIGTQPSAVFPMGYFAYGGANDNTARKPRGVYCLSGDLRGLVL
jgi:hypothetical protein